MWRLHTHEIENDVGRRTHTNAKETSFFIFTQIDTTQEYWRRLHSASKQALKTRLPSEGNPFTLDQDSMTCLTSVWCIFRAS